MPSLAESVGQTAAAGVAQQSHTVGDAMSAYHIAATAEHARQSLDLQKEENERNKSSWVTAQLQAGAKLAPAAQKIWAGSFADNLGKLYPNAHPDVLEGITRDADFVKGLATTVAPSIQEDPSITGDVFGSDLATLQEHISKRQQEMAMVSAAQLKGESIQNPRLETLAFNKHKAAVSGVMDDKPTSNLLSGYQSINNALVNYQNSGGMPGELAQLQTMLRLNAGSGGTGVAERAEGYATDLGLSKAKVMQIMTGKIQDTELSSPAIVKAIKEIAQGELANKQTQAAQQIKKKSGAYHSIYANDPRASVYRPDFDNTVRQQYAQFDLDDSGKPTGTSGSNNAQADAIKQQWLQTAAGKQWQATQKQAGGNQ